MRMNQGTGRGKQHTSAVLLEVFGSLPGPA